MVPRKLGRTGLTVSPIGLGTTKLGRNTDVKYPTEFALPKDEELSELLETSVKLGINLIVTAPFSQRENSLGEALIKAHDKGLGVLAIKGLFSGHLEARAAIEFVLQQPFIDSLIVGTINPSHLKEAATVAQNISR